MHAMVQVQRFYLRPNVVFEAEFESVSTYRRGIQNTLTTLDALTIPLLLLNTTKYRYQLKSLLSNGIRKGGVGGAHSTPETSLLAQLSGTFGSRWTPSLLLLRLRWPETASKLWRRGPRRPGGNGKWPRARNGRPMALTPPDPE